MIKEQIKLSLKSDCYMRLICNEGNMLKMKRKSFNSQLHTVGPILHYLLLKHTILLYILPTLHANQLLRNNPNVDNQKIIKNCKKFCNGKSNFKNSTLKESINYINRLLPSNFSFKLSILFELDFSKHSIQLSCNNVTSFENNGNVNTSELLNSMLLLIIMLIISYHSNNLCLVSQL